MSRKMELRMRSLHGTGEQKMVEEQMKREELDKLIGKEVTIIFVNGTMERGIVEYVPEFSAKYQWRKPGYYHVGNTDFKASHVKKAEK